MSKGIPSAADYDSHFATGRPAWQRKRDDENMTIRLLVTADNRFARFPNIFAPPVVVPR